jgi:hypothetical protein
MIWIVSSYDELDDELIEERCSTISAAHDVYRRLAMQYPTEPITVRTEVEYESRGGMVVSGHDVSEEFHEWYDKEVER